jgi:hypothetical protein
MASGRLRRFHVHDSGESLAQLTSPLNGATGVTLPVTIQWSTVPGVQAYYLYGGTAAGLNDLVNSGETLATSWPSALPRRRTVYVRLWTKVGWRWRFVDSTFSTASGRCRHCSPA